MNIKWDTTFTELERSLCSALNTIDEILYDNDIEEESPVRKEDYIEINKHCHNKSLEDKIIWVDLKDLELDTLHDNDFYDDVFSEEELTLKGCFIISDNKIMDGNHRYNTLKRLKRNTLVPVIYLKLKYLL